MGVPGRHSRAGGAQHERQAGGGLERLLVVAEDLRVAQVRDDIVTAGSRISRNRRSDR